MSPYISRKFDASRGFSLVELMVGIVIALIASLAIVQVMSSYENQKRSTTAGSEAQENGLIALTQLEQDIHNGGAGIVNPDTLSCNTVNTYLDVGGPNNVANPIPDFSLAAVSISNGASNAPDTITVRTGSKFLTGAAPATIIEGMPANSAVFKVNNTAMFDDGDLSLVMSGGICSLLEVTNINGSQRALTHNRGVNAPNNPSSGGQGFTPPWPQYGIGSKSVSLGVITGQEYSVSSNVLQVTKVDVATTVRGSAIELSKNIVQLQAQYGIADAGSQVINDWVEPTGGTWAAPTPASAKRIKALRVVLVARSGKMEPNDVTPATCTYSGANGGSGGINFGPCAWVDTSADPAPIIDLRSDPNWRKYRYKVYQTVIPLRNVIWANV